MTRTAIIGGHGKIALHLARILTAGGQDVSAFIRNPDQRDDVAETGATPVVADVGQLSTDELAQQLRGHDAVVWSAGAGGGSPERTRAVDQDAAIRSMDASAAAGVERYVMVSYFGASLGHGVPESDPFFAYAEAKAKADAHLQGTDLAWTIVAPSRLTLEAPTGQIETGSGVSAGEVSRADVAAVIAEVLARPATAGELIAFNNGSTPIERALQPSA